MSPVLIEAGIIIGVAIVVIRMAFLIGKKIIGFVISSAVLVYILSRPLWPYIEPIIKNILN